ncbi:MAG: rhomboid family intramembrane serine protease [Acidobacteriia bacterium]|nr:rhomboid family intramembrane serine protease [Terriglobia bacterium]MYG03834.1 rhomboid family intramembrane serine protease [Terriglobia bacterium]MYK08597.1 rhomboid family intramembrane serine protease [Terriglobia bacterium]
MIPLRDLTPRQRTPFVAWTLVLVNVGVFVYQYFVLDSGQAQTAFLASFAAVPANVGAAVLGQESPVAGLMPLVTSMFLHGGFMHLLGNMWFLWIFGDNVEDELGHAKFLLFYLACGVLATLAHFAAEPSSTVPLVGASGAIAGVMGAYLMRFPRSRVIVLLPLIVIWTTVQLPAFVMLLYWFAIQVLNGTAASGGAGVAWWAHVGGFVIGAGLALYLTRGRPKRSLQFY